MLVMIMENAYMIFTCEINITCIATHILHVDYHVDLSTMTEEL